MPVSADGRKKTKQQARAAWPYRFEMVPIESLFVDSEYQRPLTSFVDEVARRYDPALIGTLIVSEREGGFMAVIDGQTRMEGMRANDEPAAPCLVYHGLSRGQEARLFADLQTKRRGMATYLRFRSALVAGRELPRDPDGEVEAKSPHEAVDIAAIVTEEGFELDTVETRYTVKAISALEGVYRRDPILLRRVMRIIAQAWQDPDTPYRTSGEIIRGIAIFITRENRVNEERLINRLSAILPQTLRHRANALKEGSGSGGGSPGYMADAILAVYMRGRASRGQSAA